VTVIALVPAAGAGTRLAAAQPKAFVELAGVPLVVRAVRGLLESGVVDAVVVALPPDAVSRSSRLFKGLGKPVTVVAGGADRTASVRCALVEARRLYADAEVFLVHDAARVLTPLMVVHSVVDAVRAGSPAVVPVLPMADTVKELSSDGLVVATRDRAALRAVQTPQGFAADVLVRAYEAVDGGAVVTDDAGLVEALGVPVHTVAGHQLAFKVTTALDLAMAELLVEERR
jgi:2-C-methyl-D-erythritol 4-phosphate cytidylyltransferase